MIRLPVNFRVMSTVRFRVALSCAIVFLSALFFGGMSPKLSASVHKEQAEKWQVVDDFKHADMWYHGHHWETLTPGHWMIRNHALRRRLKNNGQGNPDTKFPWHWSTGGKDVEPRTGNRVPDLPMGMLWHRDWSLTGNYSVRATFTIRDLKPKGRGEKDGFLGLCFGGECLYESRDFRAKGNGAISASWMATWHRDGGYRLHEHAKKGKGFPSGQGLTLKAGDQLQVVLRVLSSAAGSKENADIVIELTHGNTTKQLKKSNVNRKKFTEGYFGLVAYGALDFEVNQVEILPEANRASKLQINDLHICYPLGDTMKQVKGKWGCRFIAMFRSPGKKVEIRVADSPQPKGGWKNVPVAGTAQIVDNEWRRYTSVVYVTMPISPAKATQYYTVWKDGVNVTRDPRPAESSEGYLGPKNYVGRLPQLTAPYRVCSLGGHALLHGGTTLKQTGTYQKNWVHGQPTQNAYKDFETYNFQVINWDDDVWYLELMFPPPSTDDAYKVITLTIANETTRWQMMRHWNIINPGDHDYGMDDIKGPEQILVRKHDDLGQDSEYMRRNFDINHHLTQGLETQIGTKNPKDWRRWKMPNGDFSILVLESRLWRTSQDTNIWVKGGWGHKKGLYDRSDPTRTLLGEEQFAWLKQIVETETAPLICVTGINCLSPVLTGRLIEKKTGYRFANNDRVAADYAGWVAAGSERVLQVLGSRPGIISVYGDVHLAVTVENKKQRLIESSCGPIGRGGSRGLKKDWAVQMKDFNGKPVKVHMLYHIQYDSPTLQKKAKNAPPHWNFLEQEFEPRGKDPRMQLRIRNIIDPPTAKPRGGGIIDRRASTTGRLPSCGLPKIKTIPNADVHFRRLDGRTIRGVRSLPDGTVPVNSLIDVAPGTRVIMTAHNGKKVDSQIVHTLKVNAK